MAREEQWAGTAQPLLSRRNAAAEGVEQTEASERVETVYMRLALLAAVRGRSNGGGRGRGHLRTCCSEGPRR